MTYDEAMHTYDNMDNLQRAGVRLRLRKLALRGIAEYKEVLRLAITEELQQLSLD